MNSIAHMPYRQLNWTFFYPSTSMVKKKLKSKMINRTNKDICKSLMIIEVTPLC